MKNHGHAHSPDEAIRIEAYLLSEKAGHPKGMEHTFWKQAEAIVHSRLTSKITKEKRSAKGKPVPIEGKPAAVAKKAAAAAKPKAKTVQQPLPLEAPAAPELKKPASAKKAGAPTAKVESAAPDKLAVPTKEKKAKPAKK